MLQSELTRRGSLLLGVLVLCACTVVELDEQGKPIIPADPTVTPSYTSMTPDAIANALWQTRVLPDAEQHALSWAQVKQQQSTLADSVTRSVYVRINGQVVTQDQTGREARLELRIDGDTLCLQLGPIVKGNAIRDASSFIRFDDFKNQVQFAQLSRALNKKAVQGLPAVDDSWQGRRVTVLAAITLGPQSITDAVPLALHPEAP